MHSSDQFLPTPVTSLPTGEEKGRFLAVDLGGTNLRVGFGELLGRAKPGKDDERVIQASTVTSQPLPLPGVRRTFDREWQIEDHLKLDQSDQLFKFVGSCIAEVVAAGVEADEEVGIAGALTLDGVEAGVTFSFPMEQQSLDTARIMQMGKGFGVAPDAELRDLLIAGYEMHASRQTPRRLPPLRITAIVNDAVATLASGAYLLQTDPMRRVAMALVLGTGTNAAIPMGSGDLGPRKRKRCYVPMATSKDAIVTVNTEWSISGSAAPLHEIGFVTRWDKDMDTASDAPGFQPLEYMTAGRYLGELFRIIVLDGLTTEIGIAVDDLPYQLRERFSISTTWLATEVATANSGAEMAGRMQNLFPDPTRTFEWTERIGVIILRVAELLKTRSSALTAAAVVGLLSCSGEIRLSTFQAQNSTEAAETSLPNRDRMDEELIGFGTPVKASSTIY
ncbi:MAG: hypothetical protein M1817_005326 [Caeruleum heppii]|nr:MAG: hypothetical protein M1817_005326 [Caeruleum heppii]